MKAESDVTNLRSAGRQLGGMEVKLYCFFQREFQIAIERSVQLLL